MPDITVIGSGVSGLSSAINLQLAGFDVQILTRELPEFTTSMAAGAVWSGMSAYGRARRWAQVTLEHFLALSRQADSGVSLRRMRKVFAHPADEPWYQHQLPFIERIPEKDLPADCRAGYVMDVPIVAPPLYLKNLHDQFLADGGTLTVRKWRHCATWLMITNCWSIVPAFGREKSPLTLPCIRFAGRRC